MAESVAVTGSVITHATTMCLNNLKSTPLKLRSRALPTKTTDPTLQCVVLIGRPSFDASRTVAADPISIVKPLKEMQKHTIRTQCPNICKYH